MPPREDETYRNLIGGHTRTCTCLDCTRRRRGLPSRSRLPKHVEATDEDWQAFFDEIENLDQKENPPSPPSTGQRFSNTPLPTTRKVIQGDLSPAEIRERRRRAQSEDGEKPIEREKTSSSSTERRFPNASIPTTREDIKDPPAPAEIRERRRQTQNDEREERTERERIAGTRPYANKRETTGTTSNRNSSSSKNPASHAERWLLLFAGAVLICAIVLVIVAVVQQI